MKPFLILQLRPEDDAADDEFAAFLRKGGLDAREVVRIRLDRQELPRDFDPGAFSGIIVGGGPGCVSDPEELKTPVEKRIEDAVLGMMDRIIAHDIPFLGCCYGMGILGHHLAPGSVSKECYGEPVGAVECRLTEEGRTDPLLAGLPERFSAFVGHKEAVQALPEGAAHLVTSAPCPVQMIRTGKNVYATQFHPEADGDGFETRIRIYRHHGYFPPETADALIAEVQAAEVFAPERILANFVRRYRR